MGDIIGDCLKVLRESPACATRSGVLNVLTEWRDQTIRRLNDLLIDRKHHGFIRAGHGDLHLGNLILQGAEVIPFDGIEFGDRLRWIDVLADVAFTVMDLHGRGHADLSARLLDRYLEASGDYAGAAVLPLYLTYRALVRAEIAAIRLAQESPDDPDAIDQRHHVDDFLDLALQYARPCTPRLYITVGPSGSGKTTLTSPLIEACGAVRVRSDVERRRLLGMDPIDPKNRTPTGAYTPAMHEQVYDILADRAVALLKAGFSTVVDAANLKRTQRDRFVSCAGSTEYSVSVSGV